MCLLVMDEMIGLYEMKEYMVYILINILYSLKIYG